MKQLVACPLHVALEVSPQWGATLEKNDGWIRVVPFLHWQVSVYRGRHVVHTSCGTRQAALEFLRRHGYSLDDGWLPALPT
ncbi:MAG TPA: hypothetical protein VFQ30_20335 [Ktedonobacteraceae bacterium]|nr:hypothetical protein [Ktedonobacteraceae bacterium]